MKQRIPYWQTVGFLFTAVVGTLLHFFFDLTGGSVAAALISPVNESIWEHLKLLYYPMVLYAAIEYWDWGKTVDGFWCVKLAGILLGLVLIVVVYYTYTGVLGRSADWFNITIFFLAAGIVFWAETKMFQRKAQGVCNGKLALLLLGLLGIAFIALTFLPVQIPLFRDPVTGTYGFVG